MTFARNGRPSLVVKKAGEGCICLATAYLFIIGGGNLSHYPTLDISLTLSGETHPPLVVFPPRECCRP
jgi:hypothetical protein